MTSLPRLGRMDRGIVSELRTSLESVLASVPEHEHPAALERLLDFREGKVRRAAFGGSNGI